MEYAYAALLLHESGVELNEENITRVLEASQVDVEESRVKALVAALEDVNIEEAISVASASDVPGGQQTTMGEGVDEDEPSPDPDSDEVGQEIEPDEDGEEGDDEGGIGDLF